MSKRITIDELTELKLVNDVIDRVTDMRLEHLRGDWEKLSVKGIDNALEELALDINENIRTTLGID